jgi:ADP-ribose pyrophosphatase
MTLKSWKKISESTEHKNSWWTYKKDIIELPGGKPGEYHYVHTNGSSMIVPMLGNGKIVLVNQYRYLNRRESIEFPCGGVKEGRSYRETALDELEEETGYKSSSCTEAGEFNPYNGVTDEVCRIFMAKDLIKTESRPDETEEFEVIFLSPDQIDQYIEKGDIWDGMTIAAWTIVKSHLKEGAKIL